MKPLLDVEEPAIPPEAPSPEAPRPDAAAPGGDAERVVAEPVAPELGRLAQGPLDIPWRGWKAVIRRALTEMLTDRVSLVAAGVAFYATLALFPAISMLISIYGLWFDPVTVEPQLEALRGLLPSSVSPPRLMLTTSAPSLTAQTMPARTHESSP